MPTHNSTIYPAEVCGNHISAAKCDVDPRRAHNRGTPATQRQSTRRLRCAVSKKTITKEDSGLKFRRKNSSRNKHCKNGDFWNVKFQRYPRILKQKPIVI